MLYKDILNVAEQIEAARHALVRGQTSAKPLHVSVTDPLATALVKIDQALENLDVSLGAAARKNHRERMRVEPASPPTREEMFTDG